MSAIRRSDQAIEVVSASSFRSAATDPLACQIRAMQSAARVATVAAGLFASCVMLTGCGTSIDCNSGSLFNGNWVDAGYTCTGDEDSCKSQSACTRKDGQPWFVCINKKLESCEGNSFTSLTYCDQKKCECEGKTWDRAFSTCGARQLREAGP